MKNIILSLIGLALIFVSCTKEEINPVPNTYRFDCVTGADTLSSTRYYFQVSFGDSLNTYGNDLLDYDYTFVNQGIGEIQGKVEFSLDTLDLQNKYCIMMAYYMESGHPIFVNSSFYINIQGKCVYQECSHEGHSLPFLLN